MGNQKAKRQIWETRIKAFQASGQTAVAWCEANEVNRRQLYSWIPKSLIHCYLGQRRCR
jgi:hypothetical protein